MLSKLFQRFFFVELGEGLINYLDNVINKHFNHLNPHILVISGPTFTRELADRICMKLKKRKINHEHVVTLESSINVINSLKNLIQHNKFNLLLAVGGGKVIDTVKFLSYQTKIPFVVFPTIPSNDGIASPMAVIKGMGVHHSIQTVMPRGIVIDTDILRSSPTEYILAGIGDITGNLTAVYDWRLSNKIFREDFIEIASAMAELAPLSLFSLISKPDDEILIKSPQFIEILAKSLILSGVSMGIAGSSRPCSGSEHLISHALDFIYGGISIHGIQVALGTILSSDLQKNPHKERILILFKSTTILEHLKGLKIYRTDLFKAINLAPKIREDRFTILNNASEDEIQQAIDYYYYLLSL